MNKDEIIILCNSAACVADVSAGHWQGLQDRNIFTCNMAYSHFRTSGRHLNIFSDAAPIIRFLTSEDWSNNYGTWQYDRVEFVFNLWELEQEGADVGSLFKNTVYKKSPVMIGATSAINALFYLHACEDFERIHLVGYTMNEWDGIYRLEKQKQFAEVEKKYKRTSPRPFVFTYTKNQ